MHPCRADRGAGAERSGWELGWSCRSKSSKPLFVSIGHRESQMALQCHHGGNQRDWLEKVIRTAQTRGGGKEESVGPCPSPRALQLSEKPPPKSSRSHFPPLGTIGCLSQVLPAGRSSPPKAWSPILSCSPAALGVRSLLRFSPPRCGSPPW